MPIHNHSVFGVLWGAMPEELQILTAIRKPNVVHFYEAGLLVEIKWRFMYEGDAYVSWAYDEIVAAWYLEDDRIAYEDVRFNGPNYEHKVQADWLRDDDHTLMAIERCLFRAYYSHPKPDESTIHYTVADLHRYLEATGQEGVFYDGP